MKATRRMRDLIGTWGLWLALICFAHYRLNILPEKLATPAAPEGQQPFRVGYLPVTCHLTCPVTDFIQRALHTSMFKPIRFGGFPELKEAFLSKHTSGTFVLAPMAMALREQGVAIKIVYLGHRDGTALVVHHESGIHRIEDLQGRTIAVPNRYSNQRLLLFRALRDRGLSLKDVKLVEMPPPDMPAALSSRAVDAITSGEPFMAQAELDGYGRVLYQTRDVWPGFISCVLVVHDDVIRERRADVLQLVRGIGQSGLWLEQGQKNRMAAAEFVSRDYYNQDPRLLRFVLSKPPDRVTYDRLTPLKRDLEAIAILGKEDGMLEGTLQFEDYVDLSFAEELQPLEAYAWEAP